MSTGLSEAYATPLRLELQASSLLPACLCAAHLAVALIVLLLPLVWPVRLLAGVALVVSVFLYLRRYRGLQPGSVVALSWLQGAACVLDRADGTVRRAELVSRAFVQPWLVVLYLRTGRWPALPLVIVPDMLDATQFRRLRVRLTMELDRPGKEK